MSNNLIKPLEKYRKSLRMIILPYKDFLSDLKQFKFKRCLDLGAGTGFILELFYDNKLIQEGIGVEVQDIYYKKLNDHLSVISDKSLSEIKGKYDLISIVDVLHHVKAKTEFLNKYLSGYASDHTYVFVKDMNPTNPIFRTYNRFHDLVFAGEKINEISPQNLKTLMKDLGYKVILEKQKRVFLYDHYWILFQRA